MKLTEIKVALWYETKLGVGECLEVSTRTPPSVRVAISIPIPRGAIWLRPRDVFREVPAPTQRR